MKSPIRRRPAIAALLLAPALTACGFGAQTDQVYQPAVGVNDRSGDVDVLNATIVSGTDGSGTLAATLVNGTDSDDQLDSVSGEGLTASRRTVDVPADEVVPLAESGLVTLKGEDITPGRFVEVTLGFASGQSTTMRVPVVERTGDYADVPEPKSGSTSGSDAGSSE